MSKSRKSSKLIFEHRHLTPATDTLQNRKSLFQKRLCNPGECSKGNAQPPHPLDAPLFPKLALVKGKFLLAVSEKHLDTPALCVHFEDFSRGKIRLRRDEHSQCIGIPKGLFRIAQQKTAFSQSLTLPSYRYA